MRHSWVFAALAVLLTTVPAVACASSEPAVPAPVESRTEIGVALDTYLSDGGDALILLPNRLDKAKLDFSMESLKEIDRWLQDVHTVNRLQAGEGRAGETFLLDGRGDNTVTFAGLYLGEVVRLNADQAWAWQPFETFVANNPAQAEYFGTEAGLDAYVLVSNQGVATPINQALKRVLNGNVDSVHYIGQFLSAPVDLEKALAGRDLGALPKIDHSQAPTVEN